MCCLASLQNDSYIAEPFIAIYARRCLCFPVYTKWGATRSNEVMDAWEQQLREEYGYEGAEKEAWMAHARKLALVMLVQWMRTYDEDIRQIKTPKAGGSKRGRAPNKAPVARAAKKRGPKKKARASEEDQGGAGESPGSND